MNARHKALALLSLLIALIIALIVLPVSDSVLAALSWVDAHRNIAWAAYITGYAIAAVFLIPGSILTLGAGFLFGLPVGIAVVSAGSVLGACCAFLVGRFLARDWAAERIGRLPRFDALDRAATRQGFLIVLLVRLSPLFPFNLINYGFGLTGVRFRDYLFASWIGMLPATAVYVYLGTLAKSIAELARGHLDSGWAGRALLIVGFAATIALTVLIARKATQALKAHLQTEPPRG
jgi:uncharacterized membrane protein YdjX (TVP38/TMEM64 family)